GARGAHLRRSRRGPPYGGGAPDPEALRGVAGARRSDVGRCRPSRGRSRCACDDTNNLTKDVLASSMIDTIPVRADERFSVARVSEFLIDSGLGGFDPTNIVRELFPGCHSLLHHPLRSG